MYVYTYKRLPAAAIYLLPFNALQAQSFANSAPTRTTDFSLLTHKAKETGENIRERSAIRLNSRFVDKQNRDENNR